MPTDPRTGKSLLDTVCDRFDRDARVREIVGDPRLANEALTADISPDQLALFDVSQDGSTLVAFDGQTL